VDLGLGPIDTREYTDEKPYTWNKASLQFRLSVLAKDTTWSPNTQVGIVFYSADRLYKTESVLPPLIAKSIIYGEKPDHHRILHHILGSGKVNAVKSLVTEWGSASISINNSPWNAVIYILPENEIPQWYQFSIKKEDPKLEPSPGSGVTIRNFELHKTEKPMVSAGYDNLLELPKKNTSK
jgi:hypothetical protein